jgi:hypothetical protein
LDVIESDSAMSQAVEALVDLAYDSLDIIAWALSELLERLAKVILGLLPHFPTKPHRWLSQPISMVIGPLRRFNLNYSS